MNLRSGISKDLAPTLYPLPALSPSPSPSPSPFVFKIHKCIPASPLLGDDTHSGVCWELRTLFTVEAVARLPLWYFILLSDILRCYDPSYLVGFPQGSIWHFALYLLCTTWCGGGCVFLQGSVRHFALYLLYSVRRSLDTFSVTVNKCESPPR